MTMTPKHLELFIKSDGTIVAQCRTETNGRLDDPVSLNVAGEIWQQFKTDWNAALLAQIDDRNATCEALTSAVETLTAERDAAQANADRYLEQLTAAQELLDSLTAEHTALEAERDALLARVPPEPKPREVTPAAFLERFEQQQLYRIWNSESPIAGAACWTLFTWQGLINLDSPRLHQLLAGLVAAELLTADDVTHITE